MEPWILVIGILWTALAVTYRRMFDWFHGVKTIGAYLVGLTAILVVVWSDPIHLGPAQLLAIGWACWVLISSTWAHEPTFCQTHIVRQISFVGVFLLASSLNLGQIQLVALAGTMGLLVSSIIATAQYLGWSPWLKKRAATGTTGNRNWYAGYSLASWGFVAYISATVSWYWILVGVLNLYTLLFAHIKLKWASKGSLVGLVVGILLVLVKSSGILGVVAFIMCLGPLLWWGFKLVMKFDSSKYRIKYCRAALVLIKERPFLGHGIRMFRREVYRANHKINECTNGKFLDKATYARPQPREVHNDFLGFWVDTGLIGLGLLVLTIASVLMSIPQSTGGLAIIFGVGALLGCAFVFYPLRIVISGFPFWVLLGLGSSLNPTLVLTELSWITQLIISILVSSLILKVTWDFSKGLHHSGMAFRTGDANEFRKALIYNKHDSLLLTSLLGGLQQVDPIAANIVGTKIVERYDGNTLPWTIWCTLGQVRAGLGLIVDAKACFEEALRYLPHYKPAINGLAQCNKLLNNGGRVIINYNAPFRRMKGTQDGLQNTSPQYPTVCS